MPETTLGPLLSLIALLPVGPLPFVFFGGPAALLEWLPRILAGGGGMLLLASLTFALVRERNLRRLARENEARSLAEARRDTLQDTALRLAETLATENARLHAWIQKREAKHQDVPIPVRQAAQNIGQILGELTEQAFVKPYEVSAAEHQRIQKHAIDRAGLWASVRCWLNPANALRALLFGAVASLAGSSCRHATELGRKTTRPAKPQTTTATVRRDLVHVRLVEPATRESEEAGNR